MGDLINTILGAGVVSNAIDSETTRRQVEELNRKYDKDKYEKEQQRYKDERNQRDARDKQEWEDEQREREEEQRKWEAADLSEKIDNLHENFQVLQEGVDEIKKTINSINENVDSISNAFSESNNCYDQFNNESTSLAEKINAIMRVVKHDIPNLMLEHYGTLLALGKKMGLSEKDYIDLCGPHINNVDHAKEMQVAANIEEMKRISMLAEKQREEEKAKIEAQLKAKEDARIKKEQLKEEARIKEENRKKEIETKEKARIKEELRVKEEKLKEEIKLKEQQAVQELTHQQQTIRPRVVPKLKVPVLVADYKENKPIQITVPGVAINDTIGKFLKRLTKT